MVGQPPITGQLLGGILLCPALVSWLGDGNSKESFPPGVEISVSHIGDVAAVLLCFSIGTEVRRATRSTSKSATALLTATNLIGSAIAASALWLLMPADWIPKGVMPLSTFLVMLCALSVTALPLLGLILADRGITTSKLGSLSIESAAATDLIGWILLMVALAIQTGDGLSWLIDALPLFGGLILLNLLLRLPCLRNAVSRAPDIAEFVSVSLLFLAVALAFPLGLHAALVAVAVGVFLPQDIGSSALSAGRIHATTTFLTPFFIATIGLSVDLASSLSMEFVVGLCLLLVASITSRFLAVLVSARKLDLQFREVFGLSALLNTRGFTEILVLSLAHDAGIVSGEFLALGITFAVITTIFAAPAYALTEMRRRVPPDRKAQHPAVQGADPPRE
ncbi:cation:proton antiporter [Rathayibacter toxicus]|nr:cation:proton antiporter [Rathayibacter toxicus]